MLKRHDILNITVDSITCAYWYKFDELDPVNVYLAPCVLPSMCTSLHVYLFPYIAPSVCIVLPSICVLKPLHLYLPPCVPHLLSNCTSCTSLHVYLFSVSDSLFCVPPRISLFRRVGADKWLNDQWWRTHQLSLARELRLAAHGTCLLSCLIIRPEDIRWLEGSLGKGMSRGSEYLNARWYVGTIMLL